MLHISTLSHGVEEFDFHVVKKLISRNARPPAAICQFRSTDRLKLRTDKGIRSKAFRVGIVCEEEKNECVFV